MCVHAYMSEDVCLCMYMYVCVCFHVYACSCSYVCMCVCGIHDKCIYLYMIFSGFNVDYHVLLCHMIL